VLIAGEPGIGKTALVGDVARAAFADGATVLYGRCHEDMVVPFQPWVEALEYLLQHGPRGLRDELGGTQLTDLGRMIPSLAARGTDGSDASASSSPDTERYRLFAAVVAALEVASRDAPVVLVLDDLHWADRPTLQLLRHLAGSMGPLSLLVLATHRDTELVGGHPLVETLAMLRREPNVSRVRLEGLGSSELTEMVAHAVGRDRERSDIELVQALRRETQGNPFFCLELLQHLAETGVLAPAGASTGSVPRLDRIDLPDSVREVIGARVDRLGDDIRHVLELAAVIGPDFELEVLADAVGRSTDEVLDILDRADAAGLVTNVSGGNFTFTHALIAHTLSGDLARTRRAESHRRVAEAIERLGPVDERVRELARHWAAAGEPSDAARTIDYACRSGERALASSAPDEAVRWYGKAQELLAQHEHADPELRCDVLLGLGEAQRQTGDGAFNETLVEAAALARAAGDTERLVRAALANTRGTAGYVDRRRITVLEAALAAVGPDDSAERARLLAVLAAERFTVGSFAERMALSDEAITIARHLGEPATLLFVLNYAVVPISVPETLEMRLSLTQEAVRLADSLGDPAAAALIRLQRAQDAIESADVLEADRCLEAMDDLAGELRQPALQWMATWALGSRRLLAGDVEEAERLADEALRLGTETGQPDAFTIYGGQLFCIRWHQGRGAELLDLLTQVAADRPDLPVLRAGVALLLVEAGRGAEVDVDPAALEALPYDVTWAGACVVWAEVAARLGALPACELLYRRLAPFGHQVANIQAVCFGSLAHALGILARALGRDEQAAQHLAEAESIHSKLGAPFYLARTDLERGRMLVEHPVARERRRGVELLDRVRTTARHHGYAMLGQQASETLTRSLRSAG
jgi:tetratricopeptide (TPR) repeat protein